MMLKYLRPHEKDTRQTSEWKYHRNQNTVNTKYYDFQQYLHGGKSQRSKELNGVNRLKEGVICQ